MMERIKNTSVNRQTLLLYFVALNCLLYVFFLKPYSFPPQQQEWQDFAHDYHARFQRHPPEGMDAWLQHAQHHRCETRDHYEALDQDLEYFRQQAPLQWDKVIPEGIQLTDHYMAFSLENHKLTVTHYRGPERQRRPILRLIRKLLKPVIQHSPPLKSQFVFNLHDTATEKSVNAKYPLFSVCKMDYYTNHQPLPTNKTTNNVKISYTPGPNFVASKDLLVPWWFSLRFQSVRLWFWPLFNGGWPFSYRRDAITWRGSTTSEWETGPRFELVRRYGSPNIHKLHDNATGTTEVDADFAFIRIVQKPGKVPALSPGYRFARHMFYWEMQLRKYIMDVDGNGFTSRFSQLLRSGSLVFKSTRYREWFHGTLKPYEDYVPVRYDLGDLAEKVAWAHDNPQAAEQMVQQAKQTVHHRMRVQDMQCYMYRLLLEYQTLFETQ